MTEKEFLDALERLNEEKQQLKVSKEFKIGEAIYRYLNDIKRGNIRQLFKNIQDKMASKKVKREFSSRNYNVCDKYIEKDYSTARIVVYTCVLGEYDEIKIPFVRFDNISYVLLVDDSKKYEKYKEIYKVQELPGYLLQKGNILANRYAKLHPMEFFRDYDYAIYMDGNIRVVADVRRFVIPCQVKTGIAMHVHRDRNCIYEEAKVCKYFRRGNSKKINSQMNAYRMKGFPKHFGMSEATIIASDLQNPYSKFLLDAWYDEFVRSESMRDQLAWPFVLWKEGYQFSDVGTIGDNIYTNYKIEIYKHTSKMMH